MSRALGGEPLMLIHSVPRRCLETFMGLYTPLTDWQYGVRMGHLQEKRYVMGSTGAGKTTFVNLVTDKNLQVGHGLSSSNVEIQAADCILEGGRRVRLIDVPGFDDTYISDIDILDMISTYLAVTYRSERLLSGVIYLHRITDNRVSGVSYKNIKLFHKLCGDRAQTHVMLVTSMWDLVSPPIGAAREQELKDVFWRHMIRVGATVARHDGSSAETARGIVSRLVEMNTMKLKIQREIVDEGKSLLQTTAGVFLYDEQRKLRARFEKEFAEQEALRNAPLKRPGLIEGNHLRKSTVGSDVGSVGSEGSGSGAHVGQMLSIEGRMQPDELQKSDDAFAESVRSKGTATSVQSEEFDELRKRVALLELQMRGAGGVSDLLAGATGDLTTTFRKLLLRGESKA
ncbi:hypothetical protein BOTBODRAFT_175882 [Botryobasidium botryosum FD-172 SS1]|uniref:Uncharacterized protein n=1 Tax=Botryobasidium botryosum (strain FD-172 SS1) TaxID=930990 RepID=A0A067ME66_BOTB1|nr:hypothetical protein BOTBODRAFT_175882 [Botryobasidium botryosum FD-172 SS1]